MSPDPSTSASPPLRVNRVLRAAPLLFTATLCTWVAFGVQSSPFGNRPIVDERMYIEWARRIAGGDLLGNDAFFFDPLWAYVLGALLALTRGSLLACRLFGVALAVGTVELTFRATEKLFNRRTAFVAAWLLALYGPFIFASGFLLKEPLTIHGVAWLCFLSSRTDDSAPRRWFPIGLTLGLLALLRGNFLVISLPLVLWPMRRTRAGAAFALLGLALPLSLSLGHNLIVGGQPVITTAHGGANFWLGNNPASTGTYEAPDFIEARPSSELSGFKAEAERRVGHPLTHRESSSYWFGEGLAFWRDQPLDAVALTVRKFRLMLSDYEVPDNYAFTCFRSYFTPGLWLAPLGWGALLGLALLGSATCFRDPRAQPLLLFGALYASSVVAFFVFDRYRIPLAPLVCLLAAHGLLALPKTRKGLALIAVATLAAFIPTPVSRERPWHDAQCVGTAGLELAHDAQTAEGKAWLDEATRLSPDRWPQEQERRWPAARLAP